MRKTKSALWASAVSMLLCVAMLVGTSFAWFTDSASTGVNKIQAGNLDVKLQYKNCSSNYFEDVTTTTKIFNENAIWEPGYVEYAVLKVENIGSLALQYKMGMNVSNEVIGINNGGDEIHLSQILRYAILDNDKSTLSRDEMLGLCGNGNTFTTYSSDEEILYPVSSVSGDTSKTVTLVVWMPEEVGNAANHNGVNVPSIDFGISVVATQVEAEFDSFGNDYDSQATFPISIVKQVQKNQDGTCKSQTIGNSLVQVNIPEGLRIENSITEMRLVVSEGSKPSGIIVDSSSSEDTYDIELLDQNGNKIQFSNGEVISFDIMMAPGTYLKKVYHNAVELTETDTGVADTYTYDMYSGRLTIYVNSFSPFTLISADKWGWSDLADTSWYNENRDMFEISTARQMAGLSKLVKEGVTFEGKTVKLLSGIDLMNKEWAPIGTESAKFKGTLDGNNKTISNLGKCYLFKYLQGTVKDLNIDYLDDISLVHYAYSGTCFNNVDILSGKAVNKSNYGAYVIYVNSNNKNSEISFVDCDVNMQIYTSSNGYCSAFVGYPYPGITHTLNFNNCTFAGNLSGLNTGMFVANNSGGGVDITCVINGCKNNGIIRATHTDSWRYNQLVATGYWGGEGNNKAVVDDIEYKDISKVKIPTGPNGAFYNTSDDSTLNIHANENRKFVITESSNEQVSYYVISSSIYAQRNNGTLLVSHTEKVDANQFVEGKYVSNMGEYEFIDKAYAERNGYLLSDISYTQTNGALNQIAVSNGKTYYVMDLDGYWVNNNPQKAEFISVTAYKETGEPISSKYFSR